MTTSHPTAPAQDAGLWQDAYLDQFPMDPNAMVAHLDARRQELLYAYIAETAHSVEVADALADVVREHPDALRVKETFETLEAHKRIGQEVYEQYRLGRVAWIYDLACGHGLLGVLLANRFPRVRVVCVDRERRPAFEHYLAAARRHGMPLANITFVEGDLRRVAIEPRAYVICVHGCNEATRDALRLARAAGACFAAMPCCIRDGLFLRRVAHVDDATRYAVASGVIAGFYRADKVTAIDARITNRNLIVIGGPAAFGVADAS